MLRWLRGLTAWNPQQQANGMAGFIALGALGILYIEAPPIPAGSETIRLSHVRSQAIVLRPSANATQVMASVPVQAADPGASVAADLTPEQKTERALKQKVAVLERGRAFMKTVPDYTAQFSKQELVGEELLDEQAIFLKCRHEPFSVYLRWLSGDEGREVMYVDGENDGKMIVHGGGWKARLPALTISPDSSLAMAESRYPVTTAGLMGLIDTMLSIHAEDLTLKRVAKCEQMEDQEFDGRPCLAFLVEYKDAKSSPTYRKSITLIDREWNVPVYTRNFTWPAEPLEADVDLDEATLIEHYTFTELQLRPRLAEVDFDRTNEEYRFR